MDPDDPVFDDPRPYGLPRGMDMFQEWVGNEFQLYFEYDPSKGFVSFGDTHNRVEIGKTVDWFIVNKDPGIGPLIDRLSDRDWSDAEVSKLLDQIHGDLAANALFLALKEPWRHPFNRLNFDPEPSPSDAAPPVIRPQPRVWAELAFRYEDVRHDGNAHGFRISRPGIAVGVDRRLSSHSVFGAAFQYANPRLRQDTGRVKADDFEFGLYNLTRLPDDFELKSYLGYSRQHYDFRRSVSLPAAPSGVYGAFYEQLNGSTNGQALAASVELTRPIQLRRDIRLLPVAAFDFEKAWMRGFRESAGLASLTYGNASLERTMLRFGLNAEFELRNGLSLRSSLQYARRVNGQSYPSIGARFANGGPGQPTADIWGSRIGRNALNLGLSGGWKFGRDGDRRIYLNYEAKLFNRATIQSGEIGFVKVW